VGAGVMVGAVMGLLSFMLASPLTAQRAVTKREKPWLSKMRTLSK
jgi:hypothetical protein